MKKRIHIPAGAGIAVLLLVATLSIGAVTASSQPLLWNPPCGAVTVINCTPCGVNLNLTTPPGVVAIGFVPAFGVIGPVATGPAPFVITGVFTQGGARVGMAQPAGGIAPPPLCGLVPLPGPVNGVVFGAVLGPPPGCCVDVYFNTNLDPAYPCTIFIFPGTPPCTP